MQTLSFSWAFRYLFRLKLKQIQKLKTIHMKPEANVSTKQTFTKSGQIFWRHFIAEKKSHIVYSIIYIFSIQLQDLKVKF